ncbi:MAG: D-aminoacyl-tRNA deacylase [Clostridia bacterium]
MRAVVQRVSSSSVSVGGQNVGTISKGINVLLAVRQGDDISDAGNLADRIMRLRIFPDAEGKMNLSVQDIKGGILVISQFTLYGDCAKGTRPSFTESADAKTAEFLYGQFLGHLKEHYANRIESGVFGAMMEVDIQNDGPVTLILESRK